VNLGNAPQGFRCTYKGGWIRYKPENLTKDNQEYVILAFAWIDKET
jgi:hypothetical protein